MSDTQSRGRRSDVSDRDDRRGGDREERKRSWRGDNDDRADGGREDRGFKQMKPGALGVKILVPNSLVGAIIGKGGDEMKKLKEESSCFIRLSQNDKYFPKTNERPCYIEGEPENIVKAITTIQEKLQNDNPRRGPSIDDTRKKQCTIVVGANAAGKCIGKGGENVKRLKSEFNVWVKVMGRDDSIPGLDERTITVSSSGDAENTMKAVKDILEMSLGLNNGGTDKNLDYDSYMGGETGGAGNNFNQGGTGGYNNNQGNFNNQGSGFNNQMGGNMGGRTGSMGPPGGRSGSQGPPSNMGGAGFNNMGGMAPAPNSMAPAMGGLGPNMGGNFNSQGAPAPQGAAETTQFGQPGQFQGNIQTYPNNNTNIPIQQYPGNNGSQNTGSGYGNNPGGGYSNPTQGGGYNQGAQGGFNQGAQGGYNQAASGYNQTQGYNQQPAFQGGNQPAGGGGAVGGGYQAPGGNQRGGFQAGGNTAGYQSTGNQGGNFQGGRGGFQGGRGGFNNRGGGGGAGGMAGGRGGANNNFRGRGGAPATGNRGRGAPRS